MDTETLKNDLKKMIIVECDKEDELSVNDISNTEPLFGPESALELDSLDSLQISLAIQRDYNVRIEGAKDGRIAFASINALVEFLCSAKAP